MYFTIFTGIFFIDPNEGSTRDAIRVRCRLRKNQRTTLAPQTCFPVEVLLKNKTSKRKKKVLGYGRDDDDGRFLRKQIQMLQLRTTSARQSIDLGCHSENFYQQLTELLMMSPNDIGSVANITMTLSSWKGKKLLQIDSKIASRYVTVEVVSGECDEVIYKKINIKLNLLKLLLCPTKINIYISSFNSIFVILIF